MLLRDWQPRSRATRWSWGMKEFAPGTTATLKLFPGPASAGEQMIATVYHAGLIQPGWALVHALISIDGQPWPEALPGQLYVGDGPLYPAWSCVIHFPVITHMEYFGGVHSLLIRHVMPKLKMAES